MINLVIPILGILWCLHKIAMLSHRVDMVIMAQQAAETPRSYPTTDGNRGFSHTTGETDNDRQP